MQNGPGLQHKVSNKVVLFADHFPTEDGSVKLSETLAQSQKKQQQNLHEPARFPTKIKPILHFEAEANIKKIYCAY